MSTATATTETSTIVEAHRAGRVIHDADSHLIETPGWLENYASEYVKDNLSSGGIPMDLPALQPVIQEAKDRVAGKHADLTEELKQNLFGHKKKLTQWTAFGAYEKKERSESLDIAGISHQLVFPTLSMPRFLSTTDLDLIYGGSEAMNRGMADFCGDDPRLLPVGHIPLHDPARSVETLRQAIDMGIKAIWLMSDAVEGRAPSHVDYDPIWALMEEAKVVPTLHIGSGVRMPQKYLNTGTKRELAPSLTNIESTKPKDIPVLHHSIERWITCMIYDGVLERFPNLKFGMVELGANWVPACLENLDIGRDHLGRGDIALQALPLKPSEYFQRQIRVAPLHMENTGRILRNVPKEILMFNTDYPHPEGGRDPFGAFAGSLHAVDATDDELDHFYTKNFEDLMGL